MSTDDETSAKPPERQSFLPWIGGCAGAIAALLVVGVYVAWQARSPWPEISPGDATAALERWQKFKPANYRLRLKLVGPLTGEVDVTVENGEPVTVLRNGEPLRQSRSWSSWTVDGLLQLIRVDLDTLLAEKNALRLTGEFDPTSGLPRHYRRVQFQPPLETGWDVVEWSTGGTTP